MRYEPRFIFVPLVWAVAVALVWLLRCDAWLWPVQLVQLLSASPFRFGPHFGAFVRDAAVGAATVTLILLAAFGVGATLLSRWSSERNLLTALFALALGLWVVSVAILIVGAFSVAATPCVLALSLCWLLPWPRQFLRRDDACVAPTGWETILFCFLVIGALLNLIGALAPPFEYDELEYHLGALADYRRAGRIVFLPHNFYSNLPQLTEMLYLPGSDTAAKLLHWTFGVLSALAVYAVTTRVSTRRVAVTAAALFYCVPFVQDLSITARIDLATTFFATLAFGGLLLGETNLAALAAGCAVASKWTAIPVVLLLCLIFSARSVRRLSLFAFLSSLFILPWLVKNWLLAGNPIYPLWSHAASWSAEQAALFAQKHHPSFDVAGLWQLVELPWRYSFTGPGA